VDFYSTNAELVLLWHIFPNPAKLSGSGVIFARAGFLPDLEKKCQILAIAGLQYSRTFNSPDIEEDSTTRVRNEQTRKSNQ